LIKAGSNEALVAFAAEELNRGVQSKLVVNSCDAAEGFSHQEGDLFGWALVGLAQGGADVAAPAAVEALGFVAKVSQDGVMSAGASFGPSHQLEEEIPFVFHHFRRGDHAV